MTSKFELVHYLTTIIIIIIFAHSVHLKFTLTHHLQLYFYHYNVIDHCSSSTFSSFCSHHHHQDVIQRLWVNRFVCKFIYIYIYIIVIYVAVKHNCKITETKQQKQGHMCATHMYNVYIKIYIYTLYQFR